MLKKAYEFKKNGLKKKSIIQLEDEFLTKKIVSQVFVMSIMWNNTSYFTELEINGSNLIILWILKSFQINFSITTEMRILIHNSKELS